MSAAATAAFGAETCLRPQERLAIEVQALKIELSVAALSCDASEEYNAFVRHFRAPLDRHSRTMKAYFARAYGAPDASRETLQFTTKLANRSASANVADQASFCADAKATLKRAPTMALREFEALSLGRNATRDVNLRACPMPSKSKKSSTTVRADAGA
jgi:hypothetical protein